MKKYSSIQKVKLENDVIELARKFSIDVVSTTNYSDSNQSNFTKIRDDHFISKIGEEAVKSVLSKFYSVTGPDYSIYVGKRKSWDDDLSVDGIGVAVKTQKRTSSLRYGLSWTFQYGKFRKDTILDRPESWVFFVEYDDTVPDNICYVYPPYQIKELTFGEPKLSYLKDSKKVVYENTLPKN